MRLSKKLVKWLSECVKTHYDTLLVASDAPKETIDEAYINACQKIMHDRDLAIEFQSSTDIDEESKKLHREKNPISDFQVKLNRVTAAMEILTDDEKRIVYDHQIAFILEDAQDRLYKRWYENINGDSKQPFLFVLLNKTHLERRLRLITHTEPLNRQNLAVHLTCLLSDYFFQNGSHFGDKVFSDEAKARSEFTKENPNEYNIFVKVAYKEPSKIEEDPLQDHEIMKIENKNGTELLPPSQAQQSTIPTP